MTLSGLSAALVAAAFLFPLSAYADDVFADCNEPYTRLLIIKYLNQFLAQEGQAETIYKVIAVSQFVPSNPAWNGTALGRAVCLIAYETSDGNFRDALLSSHKNLNGDTIVTYQDDTPPD